jgi:hypothetical protein
MQYTTKDFVYYLLIGKTRDGKKFRMEDSSYSHADCINMWQGRMYGVKQDGKRILLKTVFN